MTQKRVKEILEILDEQYPIKVKCYLDYEEPWQLLVATMLSAQATDNQVNTVTPKLFSTYRTPQELADADIHSIEKLIYRTGFYKNKAKSVKECMRMLVDEYDGVVPSDIDKLTRLRGVGRKTANVVRGTIFNEPCVVVDTHVKRISKRLGLTKNDDPVRVEFDLMKKLPKDSWIKWNVQIIAFGRDRCKALRPVCDGCSFKKYCNYEKEVKK